MNSEHLFKFNNLLIVLWLLFPFITSDVTACSELVNQKRLIFAPYNSCETVLAFSFLKVLPQISDIFDFFIGYEGVGQNLDKLLEKHYEFSKIMENKHGVAF